jgi:ferric enterobactin receptor
MISKRILIGLILFLFVFTAFSQVTEQKITAGYSNEPLNLVIKDLGSKNNILFAFDSQLLSEYRVNASFNNQPLKEILTAILPTGKLSYRLINNIVVIYSVLGESAESPPNPKSAKPPVVDFTIQGEIRDAESKEVLPFASVVVMGTGFAALCNEDGRFRIEHVPSDTLILQVEYIGYEQRQLKLSKLNIQSVLKIGLEARRTYLPQVLISQEKSRLLKTEGQAGIQMINPSDLASIQGAAEPDIMRTAQLLPGVSGTSESSGGLYIRGGNSDQTLVTLDGFTLYHLDHFFGSFSAVNANFVKNMRIHKGAMEARYGGRVSGLVEITGKEGNLNRTQAQIDVGILSFGGVVEAPLDNKGKTSLMITGRRAFTDALATPPFRQLFNTSYNSAVTTSLTNNIQTFNGTQDPEFSFQDANAKFTWKPTDKSIFQCSIYGGKDKLFITYADTSKNEALNLQDIIYLDESQIRNRGASIKLSNKWNARTTSLFHMGISQYSTDLFSLDSLKSIFNDFTVNFSNELSRLRDFSGRFEMQTDWNAHKIVYGYQWNAVVSEHKYSEQYSTNKISINQHALISSLYVQDKFQFTSRCEIQPGIRFNYFDRTKKFYPEPRLSVLYQHNSALLLKLSAGRINQYIQRIRAQSLYLNTPDYWRLSGDGDLPVLQSDQIVAGFNYDLNSWTFDVESYYKHNRGATEFLGVFSGYQDAYPASGFNTNGIISGTGTSKGIDFTIQREKGRHHGWISYSLMKSSSQYDQLDQAEVRDRFSQTHELKIYYEMELKHWDLSLFWIFGSGRPYTPLLGVEFVELINGQQSRQPVFGPINSATLPDYHRLDLTGSYKFMLGRTQGKIILSLFNIYNHQNIKDIQYLAVRNGTEVSDFDVAERKIGMQGFLPSLLIQLKF